MYTVHLYTVHLYTVHLYTVHCTPVRCAPVHCTPVHCAPVHCAPVHCTLYTFTLYTCTLCSAREIELEDRQSRLEAQLRERIASEGNKTSKLLFMCDSNGLCEKFSNNLTSSLYDKTVLR